MKKHTKDEYVLKRYSIVNLLVTLDSNYIYALTVMLRSLKATNPDTKFDIYVAHSSLKEEDFKKIEENINENMVIHPIFISEEYFANAPTLSRISKETYYRLLLGDFLPKSVDRILYLDPDIVILKPLDELYNLDFQGHVCAATRHTYSFMERVNLFRLRMKQSTHYVNAGVIMVDVDAWRKTITTEQIVQFISDNIKRLKLSDQDALNIIFEHKILFIDECKFNLDEKTYFCWHFLKKIDMDWVDKNTVIVHYNGSQKPWQVEEYKGKLGGYFEIFK